MTHALFPVVPNGRLPRQRDQKHCSKPLSRRQKSRVGSNLVYTHLIEGNPTLHFHCQRMLATISTSACADMWRDAHEQNSERRRQCRGCPLGAKHAGVSDANLCDIHNVRICARCRNEVPRLIWGNICVSCRNREYEYARGYNARGTPLTKLKNLEPRQVRYIEGGAVRVRRSSLSASVEELIVGTLRDAAKSVAFGFTGFAQASLLRQQRLF